MASLIIKAILIITLLVVIISLGQALVNMNSEKQNDKPMSHYLGRRLLLSGIVILIIIFAAYLGLIPINKPPI